jgi:hypothetical protein
MFVILPSYHGVFSRLQEQRPRAINARIVADASSTHSGARVVTQRRERGYWQTGLNS